MYERLYQLTCNFFNSLKGNLMSGFKLSGIYRKASEIDGGEETAVGIVGLVLV